MTKIIFFGDNDTTDDAVKVLDAIKKETAVDQYVFLGDGPYAKEGTKWVGMMKPYFPDTSKLMLTQGNHEDEESESEKTQQDIEAWLPHLKETSEVGGDQSWEKTTWLSSKQVGDIFIMCMNSQDLDIEFKRNQYNWVKKQLAQAVGLQKVGKVNWIINAVHKPWFTLKSSHSPYTAVREIYSDLFKGIVDMNWHGHNHNDQAWFPMVAIQESGNAAGEPLFSLLAADKKTLDYSKPHGWTTNIQGHSGHEHNAFKEDATANKNVMWANDKTFSYSVLETSGKKATVTWKDITGKVLFEYNITKEGMVSAPSTPTPPQPTTPATPTDPNKPTSPPPGPGFRWNTQEKKWIPILEDPSFVAKTNTPKPQTPPPPPPPPPTNTNLSGNVIWTSKGIWDNGKDRTFTSTDPDDPRSQMRAGENRSCHVDGKGTAYFSGARGRMYWYATNYDFIMQFDMIWNDTIDNIGLRGRSRHNEGGDCNNAFGGYGANYHKADMDFKSEDSHSAGGGVGSSTFKYPQAFEAGKKYGIKFQLKDDPKPHMLFWIDYKDGKGFVKVGDYIDEKPLPCRVNRKSFEEISYLWLRTNGGAPKDYAVSNVVILETSGIKQSDNKGADYEGGSE
jgi:calcineurin-like phosphoesterase family protein